ncbi:cyclic nucleotide-binding-like protein, partial [Baffinella frigidus]
GACTLLCLSRETFRLVLQSTVTDRNSYLETRLLNIPLLENLNKAQVAKLVDAVVTKTYAEGDVIIQKGELGDELFIMFDGTAVTSGSDIGADKVKYGPGEFFGELALLRDQPRAATVTATSLCTVCIVEKDAFTSLCTVCIVEKDAFTRLLGPCEEILRGRASEILHSSSGSDNADNNNASSSDNADNNNASSSNSGNNSSGSAGCNPFRRRSTKSSKSARVHPASSAEAPPTGALAPTVGS